jgi:hypothetical protein
MMTHCHTLHNFTNQVGEERETMEIRQRQHRLAQGCAAACIFAGAAFAMLISGAPGAQADEHLNLIAKIDVGGKGLGAFDISYVDPELQLYVLSDRTNGSVDLFDPITDTFIERVSGFKGVVLNSNGTANNNLSGPDGVITVNHTQIWAGDGDSTVKVIDIATHKIIDVISTGGKFRADEMSLDRRDHILAAANNADTPPFLTLINTDTRKVIGRITFDGTNGTPDATNGLEQSQWSPKTGLFYVSVPQVGPDTANGGMAVIDPSTQKVITTFPVQDCTPAGLTLGPRHRALLGCGSSFGTSPNVLTQSIVINIVTGKIKANITQVGGSDEVWFDRGSNHYYLAARNNTDNTGKIMPILGVVDAESNMFDGGPATSTTAHSVAADELNRHVFVPIGFVPPGSKAGTDPTNPCPTHGCIAVYEPSRQHHHQLGDEMSMESDH